MPNWLRHLINFIIHLRYNHWTVDSDIVSTIFSRVLLSVVLTHASSQTASSSETS